MSAKVEKQHPYRTCVHGHDCDFSPCPHCSKQSRARRKDLTVQEKTCYDPADYIMVHKNYVERTEAFREDWIKSCDALSKLEQEKHRLRATIKWVLADSAFKAPEQITPDLVRSWIEHLRSGVECIEESQSDARVKL
jgi:hypothetical protein